MRGGLVGEAGAGPDRPALDGAAPGWRNELGGPVHGPAIQAQAIHGGVHLHGGGAPPVPVPAQLPAVPARFTSRSAELARLSALLEGRSPPVTLAVITGVGGAGKTSLALRWLHEVSGRFGGGSLYADLGGAEPGGAGRPAEVAGQFLRAVGVPPDRVPADLGEAAALWRSVTAGRPLALLLDDAVSAAQVRAVLPGAGPSLVVVTSRHRLTGLAIEGAHFTELGPLPEADAVELLDQLAGGRARAEPEAARAVVQLCGRLPLAISVSGARLAANPRWRVRRIADELASERDRLVTLSLDEDMSVRAAFDVSWRALPPEAARAYWLLAVLPGPEFSAELAAAATGTTAGQAGRRLDALTGASLLEEVAEDRFRYHDLVRVHARELAGREPEPERQSVTGRAVAWYLDRAVAADLVVIPGRWQLGPRYEQARREPPAFGSVVSALDWLESELPGLAAAVAAAHESGQHEEAWQLCEALWGLFQYRRHYAVWTEVTQAGLASARAAGNVRAQARMLDQLGFAFLCLHRYEQARGEFSQSVTVARAAGDRLGEAAALEHTGLALMGLGRPGDALGPFEAARATHLELGRERGIALATRHIGEALRDAGRLPEAAGALAEARLRFRSLPDPYNEARSAIELARTLLAAGRGEEAPGLLAAALRVMTDRGATGQQGVIHVLLADAAQAAGDPAGVREHLSAALACYELTGGAELAAVRQRLTRSQPADPAPGGRREQDQAPS